MHPIANRTRNQIVLRCSVYAASFAVACCWIAVAAHAQSPPFPSGNRSSIQSNISSGAVEIPQTNLTPIAPPPFSPSSNGLEQFDPYGITPSARLGSGMAPPIGGIGPGIGSAPGFGAPPGSAAPPSFGASPSFGAPPILGSAPNLGSPPSLGSAWGGGTPSGVAVIGPPTAVLPFPQGSSFGSTGEIAPSPPGGSLLSRIFSRPASSSISAGFGTPGFSDPTFGAPIYDGGSQFPSSVYPSSTPSVLFPGGLFGGGVFPGDGFAGSTGYDAFRLFQGPRLRHDFVSGGNKPTHLGVNNTDTSLVFAFPNFLYGARPLFVIPSFSLHLWDGPNGSTGADLPPSAYSGFLDVGWESDPNQMFSTEMGIRVGAFTDFDTFNNDSIRLLGKALLSFRVTPAATVKGGLYYLDRNRIKLIPAGGVFWQPNPFTRIDLFFPQPKFARYWRTIGTRDFWWYAAGDYGGGSWTIERTNKESDSVDINELRVVLGMEWGNSDAIRARRRKAFVEVGYAFDREIEYRFNPQDNIKPDDGIMVRAGIGY